MSTIVTKARQLPVALGYIAILIGAAVLYLALYQLPYFGDFDSVYYPILHLDNPYEHPGFLNPPWTAVILRPLRLLPMHPAGALWMLLSILSVVYCANRLGSDRLGLALTFTCPAFIRFITSGQVDALVLWGLVLNQPPWDVLLLAVKPQVGGTAVLFKLREYRPRDIAYLMAAVAISLLIWWNWPLQVLRNWQAKLNYSVSMDIWPYGVPFGLAFLAIAWRRRDMVLGTLSSYFLVPYISPSSIFIYAVLIFATFPAAARLVVYALLWIVALVLA